ncbi:DUF6538 domain-containing protein [Bradyrhizobium sp. dw_78]|uniref:DUF6538 domain-containing protein n=1 Tax=Bradyrhizobium sp. dw_78 TaxID=2719793 RepID=UPI001BD6A7D7|nr:DUF6538 domain-containing protein [Bradyrhizobium sp. dw_78]
MASPSKREGTDNWYYRTIPADVRAILEKLPKGRRPPGWYKTHISISLRTADRTPAKAKYTEVAAEVERQLRALRDRPKPLTAKQVAALLGILHRTFAQGFEDTPGLTKESWLAVARQNRLAQQGKFGLGAIDRFLKAGAPTILWPVATYTCFWIWDWQSRLWAALMLYWISPVRPVNRLCSLICV